MSSQTRPAVEENLLLPPLEKILVVILTLIYEWTNSLAIEEALGAVVAVVGVLLVGVGRGFTWNRVTSTGWMLFLCGCLAPLFLAPPSVPSRTLPAFSVESPPTFPLAGRVTRQDLTSNGPDGWFREKNGAKRVVMLRGVNFGASSKIPSSEAATHLKTSDFYSGHRDVSFVSRPCPLEDADEHFKRIASWGFNIVRLLITWEAVEHKGPKMYDYEYLRYLRSLCRKAAAHGISIFIDPHQDVWSRFTGGDGAPGWTLEKVGFKLNSDLFETGAALTHQEFGDPLPRMSWPTNFGRLACGTMFTLFFAGNDYAPKTKIDGIPAQEYLQEHFASAMKEVAKALKDEQNVLGFDTMNEPSNGFVGMRDVRKAIFPVPLGHHLSVYDGMVLGAGASRRVNLFKLPFVFNNTILMNPKKISIWQTPAHDVWRNNGVWDLGADGEPKLLRPAHFKLPPNTTFIKRYMLPFFERVGKAIRAEVPDLIVFAEPHIEPTSPVHHHAPSQELVSALGGPIAWAPHYYDAATLTTKTFRPWYALDAEREMLIVGTWFVNNVFQRAAEGLRKSGHGLPVLVGETGVPMDFAGSLQNEDFSLQMHALNRVLGAMERQFLSWTLWTYTPDNTNARGDLWNGEDLSLWSRDQVKDKANLNSGGRALEAAVRPYPMKIAGEPMETEFDVLGNRRRFFLKVRLSLLQHQQHVQETIIFVPLIQYPNGIEWKVGGKGSSTLHRIDAHESSASQQGYIWRHDLNGISKEDGQQFVEQWVEIETKA